MSKQDRQGVRKASDIEQKYNLAMIKALDKGAAQQKSEFSKFNQAFTQFAVQMNASLKAIDDTMIAFSQLTDELNQRLQLLETMSLSVGSVHITLSEDNPSEIFGGEWELIAQGQVLLGVDSQSEFPELFQAEENCFIWKRIS